MKKKGVKKPLKEIIDGEELNISENKWVQKTRIIDRENDIYYEEVSDLVLYKKESTEDEEESFED